MNTQEQPQELREKQQEVLRPKSPYTPPMLVRLGSVRQVTEGIPLEVAPDDSGLSY